MAAHDPLSRVFSALADPTRRAILSRLSSGSVTVSELAAPFDVSLSAISQHLRVLEGAGLIERTVNAQWRTVEIRIEPLCDVEAWITEQRGAWNERFDALEERLRELTTEGEDQ